MSLAMEHQNAQTNNSAIIIQKEEVFFGILISSLNNLKSQ